MEINRHNYESYFILYMDNELDSETRRQVEAFVELHPDLKDELDLLFQYKLVPDTNIVFSGKEDLLRTAEPAVLADNDYESMLLSGIDHELTPEQEEELHQFLATHPVQAKEYALLQRARLVPETILFPDKASLYREEARVRRLPFRWKRVAAAAILLLGIGITAALVLNRTNNTTGLSKDMARKENTVPAPSNDQAVPAVPAPVQESLAVTTVKEEEPQKETIAPAQNVVAKSNDTKNTTPERTKKEEIHVPVTNDNNNATALQNNKPTNDLPKPVNNPYVNNQDVADNPIASHTPKEISPNKDPLTTAGVTNPDSKPSDIQTAVYTSDVAALDQPSEKKSKNRGLFRKIARNFEKRTNIDPTDDNKLLVAGLSLRLK